MRALLLIELFLVAARTVFGAYNRRDPETSVIVTSGIAGIFIRLFLSPVAVIAVDPPLPHLPRPPHLEKGGSL
jgi:hypothetical protein